MSKRIVIVGGVAAGASAAAKARRTSEDVEIVMIEAGPYVSFANCGLPYYMGGEIGHRDALLVVRAETFAKRFNIEVRTATLATAINRSKRTVSTHHQSGKAETLGYDRLILATGATAVEPPVKGIKRDNVFFLRTIPDVEAIRDCIEAAKSANKEGPARALIVGGGYIGLEAAEQLVRQGLQATLVEMADQVMPTMDVEMAYPLQEALTKAGCRLLMRQKVKEVVDRGGSAVAVTEGGEEIPFDLAIVAVGVRPNAELARQAALALGADGAIKVDYFQRTSDALIYAAGDNSQVQHLVLNRPVNIPLAGPANKAGRVAGANAALDLIGAGDDDGRRLRMGGVLGTAIVRVGDTVAAMTGVTESTARREDISADVMYIPGASHARYYPGAAGLLLKLVYSPADGRLLGAQAVGGEGVDKRIDVLATAIAARMTVEDLENLDLCYAPPFGSAKDAEILAGFAAANVRRGQMPAITPAKLLEELAGGNPPAVIDVRSPGEYRQGHMEQAVHIPVNELRARLNEVPADRPIVLYCAEGYRSYVAQRFLMNRGYTNVRNVLGGYSLIVQTRRALGK